MSEMVAQKQQAPVPTDFESLGAMWIMMREAFGGLQGEIKTLQIEQAMVRGKVLDLDGIDGLKDDARRLKDQIQALPDQMYEARMLVDELQREATDLEAAAMLEFNNHLMMAEGKTRAEREAAAGTAANKDKKYKEAAQAADAKDREIASAKFGLSRLEDHWKGVGRESNVLSGELKAIGDQLAIINGGMQHD